VVLENPLVNKVSQYLVLLFLNVYGFGAIDISIDFEYVFIPSSSN